MNNIINWFLIFMIISFFGWIMEIIYTLFDEKKLINRGFLIGPLCPIYGVGVTLMHFLLKRYMYDPFVLFIMAILVCSLLEYFTSYLMEKIFKARWWDYSHKKYNINGRICLENMIAFGLLSLLVMYVLIPFFLNTFAKIPQIILLIITFILLIVFLTDIIISFKVISGFKNVAKSMKKDNTEEITKKVRELLLKRGGLYKRLILAFKDFKASERLLRITNKFKRKEKSSSDIINENINKENKVNDGNKDNKDNKNNENNKVSKDNKVNIDNKNNKTNPNTTTQTDKQNQNKKTKNQKKSKKRRDEK